MDGFADALAPQPSSMPSLDELATQLSKVRRRELRDETYRLMALPLEQRREQLRAALYRTLTISDVGQLFLHVGRFDEWFEKYVLEPEIEAHIYALPDHLAARLELSARLLAAGAGASEITIVAFKPSAARWIFRPGTAAIQFSARVVYARKMARTFMVGVLRAVLARLLKRRVTNVVLKKGVKVALVTAATSAISAPIAAATRVAGVALDAWTVYTTVDDVISLREEIIEQIVSYVYP